MCREKAFTNYYTFANRPERLGVVLTLTMHTEERVKSPTSRCTKRNDKRDAQQAARRGVLAPALEHRDQSNEEEQDGSGG